MTLQALGTVPYFIALDRIRNNIVVSIRGSYSLQVSKSPVPRHTLFPWECAPAEHGIFGPEVSTVKSLLDSPGRLHRLHHHRGSNVKATQP